jgi:hypothetical protein
MANVYTSTNKVDTENAKRVAYHKLRSLIDHLEGLGVDLLALSVNPDKTISITLTGPVSAEQLAHLGLT